MEEPPKPSFIEFELACEEHYIRYQWRDPNPDEELEFEMWLFMLGIAERTV